MPTYEYACLKCGAAFDLFQSMKDAPIKICPKDRCPKPRWGKGKVQRQVGIGAGLIFKGSGFYTTDYRSEGYKASAKSDSAPVEAKGGETKKPEAKTETKTAVEKPKAAAKKKESK